MKFWRTLRTVLREIFEEAAFERYCAREQVACDRESYTKFLREAHTPGSPKLRCC
jgi:hypothetical protein